MTAQIQPTKTANKQPSYTRSISASEIARNLGNFEIWSTYQPCEQVSYADMPEDFKDDVFAIFDTKASLPKAWLEQSFQCTSEFAKFIHSAYDSAPGLFSDRIQHEEAQHLFEEISVVMQCWKRLHQIRPSREKWSEADFAANIYSFRSQAVRASTFRVQRPISLSQPLLHVARAAPHLRVLNTKTATPDCSISLPLSLTNPLSHSGKSPYKILKKHPSIVDAGSTVKGSSFRYQSTPCAHLPEMPGFEFVSSLWEDKKARGVQVQVCSGGVRGTSGSLLDDAYRQNRMGTAASVRHLHSLGIDAPVIGLVWASGSVRAHVDWCEVGPKGRPTVMSAPYSPGKADGSDQIFHEWLLDNPADILQVYFVIRNIDEWTVGAFHRRVVSGLERTAKAVLEDTGYVYRPWKRVGPLVPVLDERPVEGKENIDISAINGSSSSSLTKKTKTKRKKRRSSH